VYTEGSNSRKMEYKTTGKYFFDLDKLSVLVDESSASGSEILAGAVQDWDRGIVVGRRTFGKGLVQEQYSLSNGGALRLTVAKYYTPTGRLIQRPYDDREEYRADSHDRIVSGELTAFIPQDQLDTLKFFTKEKKRVVYGGGGITPDLFIPLDERKLEETYRKIARLLPEVAYSMIELNPEIKNINFEEFLQEFDVLNDFSNNVENLFLESGLSASEFQDYQTIIPQELKAQIAYFLFGEQEKWIVLSTEDEAVLQSLMHFKKKDLFAELN
jgi:carboxyl-terminal processing protease